MSGIDDSAVGQLSTIDLAYLEHNEPIYLIVILALVITVIWSYRKGGFRELIENTFLWALLSLGILNLFTYPVSEDDEITGVLLFVAFGVCRIAKNTAKSTHDKNSQG